MVVAATRRRMLRPKLDEPCPTWARELISLSQQEHGLGVPLERVPQATLEELAYYFPVPADPKRKRNRESTAGRAKTYTRTSGMAVYLGCLPFALAKQLDLFSTGYAEGPGEVAVLSFRKLADLARRLGLSYDRLQRQMTILLSLGFIWRFRSGKQLLYVIPLTAYRPAPSPEGVRARLTALIESQLVEEELADGTRVCQSRCPDYTEILIEVRSRFERRYQLEPSWPADRELLSGPAGERLLSDIQRALPDCSREELAQLVPIIAQHLIQESQLRTNQGGRRRWVLRSGAPAEDLPGQPTLNAQITISAEREGGRASSSGRKDFTESRIDHEKRPINGAEALRESTASRQSTPARNGGQSRFVAGDRQGSAVPHTASQAVQAAIEEDGDGQSNLVCAGGTDPLTLRVISLQNILEENGNDNVKDSTTPAANLQQDEEWCQKQGASLAKIFTDPESLNFYVGVHRANEPELVRAVFIKTLYQASHGGFKKSAGAYFNYMLSTWRVYRTYEAACAKWGKWNNKRDPKGIPPNIQQLTSLYQLESYEQIAAGMGYGIAEMEHSPWSTTAPIPEQLTRPMTRDEAEQLVDQMKRQAAWYLLEPQAVCEPTFGPGVYVVDAWQDNAWVTFTSPEAWSLVHAEMLTPSADYDSWLNATAQERGQTLSSEEDGLSADERERCVRAALAVSERLGWGDMSAFAWKGLVALGKPFAFPVEAGASDLEERDGEQAPEDAELLADQDGLQVRLDDGTLLSVAAYEHAFQAAERARAEEEWECSPQGAMELLQRELGLSLQLCILRTCGLPMYQAFLAQAAAGGAAMESGYEGHPAEARPASPEASGGQAQVSLASFERLARALDSTLYRVKWSPRSEQSGCSIEVESLLSGALFTYEQDAQVADLLADLQAQGADEDEEELAARA